MKTIFCFFLMMASMTMVGQEKKVFVKITRANDDLVIIGHNQIPYPVQVRFEFVKVKELKGDLSPVVKQIPARDSIVLKRLKAGDDVSLSYKLKKEFPESVLAKKEISLADHPDLKMGIVVFNSDACPRCHYMLNYLLEHQVDFRLLNLKKSENKQLMWQMLRDAGYQGSGVDTPVVLVDGKLSYNHKDLKDFVTNL